MTDPKPTGFTFGSPIPAGGGFNFGASAAADGKSSLFSTPATTAPKPASGFGFGMSPAQPAATPAQGLSSFGSLPAPNAPASTTSTGLSLGITPLGGSLTTSAPNPVQPQLNFGLQPTAVSAATTTTAAASFNFGPPAAAPATSAPTFSGFNIPAAGSTASTSLPASTASLVTPAPAPLNPLTNLTTGTNTTQAAAANPTSQLNFCQLEEYINKWTLELEEQEKVFTNQATQINAWDRVLIENSEKIVGLNEAVEKVKTEQTQLQRELEYIEAQHSELDECIKPLENELSKSVQYDSEREHTYLQAESLDTQLKQMSEDLKEVIEHLNEANKDRDPNDPIVQIGKILNAHMSSLQWIESSTSNITTKLDEISRMQETLKRDNNDRRLNI